MDFVIFLIACTPDLFPDLMATAINRGYVNQWASKNNISILK